MMLPQSLQHEMKIELLTDGILPTTNSVNTKEIVGLKRLGFARRELSLSVKVGLIYRRAAMRARPARPEKPTLAAAPVGTGVGAPGTWVGGAGTVGTSVEGAPVGRTGMVPLTGAEGTGTEGTGTVGTGTSGAPGLFSIVSNYNIQIHSIKLGRLLPVMADGAAGGHDGLGDGAGAVGNGNGGGL